MVVFTFLPTLGLMFIIWSKGFKDCTVEIIITIFQIICLIFWSVIYYESDENVKNSSSVVISSNNLSFCEALSGS